MHKIVGPVERFERFLTHAKLYRRAANTARPYPLPPTPTPPTVLKPSKHNSFDLSTLYWMGRGRLHGFVKWHHCFSRHYLWYTSDYSYALTVPRTLVHDCRFKFTSQSISSWRIKLFRYSSDMAHHFIMSPIPIYDRRSLVVIAGNVCTICVTKEDV